MTVGGVKEASAKAGSAAMSDMAKAISDHMQEPLSAFDTLKSMIKNSLHPLQEIGKNAGILTSKLLANAFKDNRADVVAQAYATVTASANRLGELAVLGGKTGKAAMAALDKGIRSKIPAVSAASKAAKDKAVAQLNATKKPAAAAGTAAAKAFGNALEDHIRNFRVVVDITTVAATDNSGKGSYATGAWKIKKNEMAFLHAGEMVVPAAAAQRLRESASSPNRYHEMGLGGGDRPSIGTMNLTINAGSDVSRSAAARFGQHVLDAVADGLREQTARMA
jgi:hypothetical protein